MVQTGQKYVKVIGQGHLSCMAQNLKECWDKECYANVKFICNNSKQRKSLDHNPKGLSANKAVLAAVSKRLATILSGTDDDIIVMLPDYDQTTCQTLLKYAHTGNILESEFTAELEKLMSELDVTIPQQICKCVQFFYCNNELDNSVPHLLEDEIMTFNAKLVFAEDPDLLKIKINNMDIEANIITQEPCPIQQRNTKEDDSITELKTFQSKSQKSGENSNKYKEISDHKKAICLLESEKIKQQQLIQEMQKLETTVQHLKNQAKLYLAQSVTAVPQIKKKTASSEKIACSICGKMISKDYMTTHVKIHSSDKPYLCDLCGQTFALRSRLQVHQKDQHGQTSDKLHLCPTCGKLFKKPHYLKTHMTMHKGEKPYACPHCDRRFRLQPILRKHIRVHTGERPYECQVCDKRFASRTNYVNHTQTHKKKVQIDGNLQVNSETQLIQCEYCPATFHRLHAFIMHRASHTGETPALSCSRCSSNFSSLKLLRQHICDEHSDSLYCCSECPRKFANKSTLYTHSLVHKYGKRFTCSNCNKNFGTKVLHDNHVKSVHSDERPFPCQWCQKTFKTMITLRQHIRIHTDERPYKCSHCTKSFRQGQHLSAHLVLHTGEKPFKCSFCEKAFAHKNNLNNHLRIHTGDRIQCHTCGQVFPSLVKLRRHENIHTGNGNGNSSQDINHMASSSSHLSLDLPPDEDMTNVILIL